MVDREAWWTERLYSSFEGAQKARLEKLCRRADGTKVLFSQQPLNGLQSNALSGSSSVSKGKAMVQGVGQRSYAKILHGTGQKARSRLFANDTLIICGGYPHRECYLCVVLLCFEIVSSFKLIRLNQNWFLWVMSIVLMDFGLQGFFFAFEVS